MKKLPVWCPPLPRPCGQWQAVEFPRHLPSLPQPGGHRIARIRVGMTANAELELARRENTLLVPNGAIQVDRTTGTYSVILVQTNEQGLPSFATVEVTIGLRDSDYTEVTSGIQDGDELLDPTADNPFQGPGNGGGPGGRRRAVWRLGAICDCRLTIHD